MNISNSSGLNVTSPEAVSTFAEQIIRSGSYSLYSVILLIPYAIILWILNSEPKNYSSCAYRIILYLGYVDCFTLFIHNSAFFFTLFQVPNTSLVVKCFGAFLNSAAYIAWVLSFLLACNRFLWLCFPIAAVKRFETIFFNKFIILGYLWGLIWCAVYLLTTNNFLYYVEYSAWGDDNENEWWECIAIIEAVQVILFYGLAFIFYILIVIKICLLKKSFHHINYNFKQEIELLIQAIIISGIGVSVNLYWNFSWLLISDVILREYLGMILWITANGSNCIVYIVFNRTIRHDIFRKIGLNNNKVALQIHNFM